MEGMRNAEVEEKDEQATSEAGDAILCYGGNSNGQLGLGHYSDVFYPAEHPLVLPSAQPVVKLFCGYEHAFAITLDDQCYAFGRNSKGECGLGHTDPCPSPQRVHMLSGKKIVLMSAGAEHSLALTADDKFFSFGCNRNGELALGHTTPKELTPQRVPSLCGVKVKDMASGKKHSLVLTADDQLLSFGCNRTGQLGIDADGEGMVVASVPQNVVVLSGKGVAAVACGGNFSVVLLEDGSLYSFGEGAEGQLGLGNRENVHEPTWISALEGKRVVQVSCGLGHVVAITMTDDVYSWGSNSDCQLGQGRGEADSHSFNFQCTPRRVLALGGFGLEYAACGARHTILKVSRGGGQLMCMGSNRQGEALAKEEVQVEGASVVGIGAIGGGGEASRDNASAFLPHTHLCESSDMHAVTKGSSTFIGRLTGLRSAVASAPTTGQGLRRDLFERLHQRGQGDICLCTRGSDDGADSDDDFDDADSTVTASSAKAAAAGNLQTEESTSIAVHMVMLRARCPQLYEYVLCKLACRAQRKEDSASAHSCSTDATTPSVVGQTVRLPRSVTAQAGQLLVEYIYHDDALFHTNDTSLHHLFDLMVGARRFGLSRLVAMCEKRVEAQINVSTVAGILRRSVEGNFQYMTRQCLQYCLDHYGLMSEPEQALTLVTELRHHPQTLADMFSLSTFYKAGKCSAPCIEALPVEPAHSLSPLSHSSSQLQTYQVDMDHLFEQTVPPSVSGPVVSEALSSFDGCINAGGGIQGVDASPQCRCCGWKGASSSSGSTKESSARLAQSKAAGDIRHPLEAQGDFTIRLGENGYAVRVHRAIVSARCGYFTSLFGGCAGMAESIAGELVLNIAPLPTISSFLAFLRFVYTARVDHMTALDGLDAWAIADYLQVSDEELLKEHCRKQLTSPSNGISKANCVEVICRADVLGDDVAREAAMRYFITHFVEIASVPESLESMHYHPTVATDVMHRLALLSNEREQEQVGEGSGGRGDGQIAMTSRSMQRSASAGSNNSAIPPL